MPEGKVNLDAQDWGELKVLLAALPKIEERLGRMEERMNTPVHQACAEHAACARAAFGARKFQWILLGGLLVVNAVLIPLAIAWVTGKG